MATLKKLKSWFYPVTPLTIITPLAIIIAIQSVYIGLTHESPMILYPIIVVPITGVIVGLYVLDRFAVKSTPYTIIFTFEIILTIGGYISFSYLNATNDIHITTNQDYILVIYDAKDNSMNHFRKTGLFSKELQIHNHVFHLNPSLCHSNTVRILPPENWKGGFQNSGKYFVNGDSIPYLYVSKHFTPFEQKYMEEHYIDSLLATILKGD